MLHNSVICLREKVFKFILINFDFSYNNNNIIITSKSGVCDLKHQDNTKQIAASQILKIYLNFNVTTAA